ncbi:MAG TPA: hypothetical protein VMT02_01220 [Burkholderiales bacterium]|nr:hypothetical protein [Burkholderiales bacterium]
MRSLTLAAAALLLAGCASLEAPFAEHLEAAGGPLRDCAEWFAQLDAQVAEAQVRDAQDARIPGFPYLRVSRLLAALRPLASADENALQALADRMLALDQEARRYEIQNLPPGRVPEVAEFVARTQRCGKLLREVDLAKPDARRALLERAQVPDDYSSLDRLLGLYALTRLAFASGVRRYEAETRASFAREPVVPEGATLIRYAPPPARALPRARVAAILARSAANPLGIPEPGEDELAQLFAAYAPSFEVAVRADYDRPGALRWTREGAPPRVDAADLAVYARPAWTRYEGRVLLQLVYTVWFSERPPRSEDDILAGKLDGLVWRVTLAPDGEPLVYDSIHPCGCFHLFFPTPRAEPRSPPDDTEEWLLAPQALPRLAPGERPLLRVASGTHYIERVGITHGSDSLVRYELRPYAELRSLQRFGPGRASAFGEDGLVAGSERAERFLFWPMGIASAGAMRQWGRQATAFVGRRHFDDADLLEKRFRLDLRAGAS